MARLFVEGNENLFNLPLTGDAQPLTFGAIAIDNNGTDNDREIIQFADASSPNNFFRLERAPGDNQVQLHKRSGPGDFFPSGTDYTVNEWFVGMSVFREPVLLDEIWQDGILGDSDTEAATPDDMDVFLVGAEIQSNTAIDWWDGDIASAAQWRTDINPDEALAFGLYFDPILIRPEALDAYLPMLEPSGDLLDLITGNVAVEAGTSASVEALHPPMLMAFEEQQFMVPAAADGAIAGSIPLALTPAATLAGLGELSGSSALAITPAADLVGLGELAGAIAMILSPAATLAGVGALAGSVPMAFVLSGTVAGLGELAGSAALVLSPAATIGGLGALAGSSALIFTPSGDLVDAGANAIEGSISLVLTPSGTVAGLGALAGSAALVMTPSATLAGLGALAGSAALVFGLSGTLVLPAGALAGSVDMVFTPAATIRADAALAGSVDMVFTPQGSLAGLGALVGSVSLTIDAAGDMIAFARADGSVNMAFDVSGDLQGGLGPIAGSATITLTADGTLAATGSLEGIAALAFTLAAVMFDAAGVRIPNSIQTLLVFLDNSLQDLDGDDFNSIQSLITSATNSEQ